MSSRNSAAVSAQIFCAALRDGIGKIISTLALELRNAFAAPYVLSPLCLGEYRQHPEARKALH
jgi:hypothetical protein